MKKLFHSNEIDLLLAMGQRQGVYVFVSIDVGTNELRLHFIGCNRMNVTKLI